MAIQLIAREPEQEVLRKTLEAGEAELVAVYGRRRVGKTFLVREFFGKKIRFELTGVHDAPLREQLTNFANALVQITGANELRPPTPTSWQEAFQQLTARLRRLPQGRKHVIFFDELPWLASRRSRFVPALEHFWNSWASRQPNLIVVVCGSSASWMIKKIIDHRGGLHNRVTRRIQLMPFTLAEAHGYLASRGVDLGQRQTLELYMAMGGVPHYLKEIEPGLSAAQNIDAICFSQAGLLRVEFDRLYASLFEMPERHVQVIRKLARKRRGMTRGEILEVAGLATGGGSTVLLDELVLSGFVMRTVPFGKARKDALYRLADEYSQFYLDWIERRRSSGDGAWLLQSASPSWRAWSGYAFETVCLKHVAQLKQALGIRAVATSESSWWHRPSDGSETGAQIDLLIDRRDQCINLCEMKFSEVEFVIDKGYARALRNKLDLFRRVTRTRKTMLLTMVTTCGVRENLHRRELVANTVEMDALFA